jgi:glycosyltransferase involved in cell wall biosynthesis
MCAADAFCVPSRWEGLGSIVVEAMALGAPVISADIPPIRELDPMGLWLRFFTPEDSKDLANTAIRVLTEPPDVSRSESAVSRFECSFRSDQIAAEMLRFFERAATASK